MARDKLGGPLDFTDRAYETFVRTVEDPYYRDKDYSLIYDTLRNSLRLVPFGDFLKRYIYKKAEMTGDYRLIPLTEYQLIIIDSFSDRGAPASFTPTTARLTALSKNWLTQQSVRRSVVLILGFGLGMSEEDVNEFLTKALGEQIINPKDPLEVVCWYCYRYGYPFSRFQTLWNAFQALPADDADDDIFAEETVGVRGVMVTLDSDRAVLNYLRRLRRPYEGVRQSVVARETFDSLYARARHVAASLLNDAEERDDTLMARRLRDKLSRSDRMYTYQKEARVKRQLEGGRRYTAEDVTPADIERIICAAVPEGTHGNLMPAKQSQLNEQFSGKRFSRQHISEVLAGHTGIDRFDLITLNFFLYAGNMEAHTHTKMRYTAFIDTTNRMLERCGMGPVYIANPYECFLLMCMLTEDPLGTYADVVEVSYTG